jgi:sialic acid synthase SpsE
MSKGAALRLDQLGVNLWKVGSADVSDFVLIDFLSSTGKPIIISSGMVSLEELKSHLSVYERLGSRPAILYCVSKYPCEQSDFNMLSIKKLLHSYPGHVIGFSDHSVDNHVPVLSAVKFGARIIEKHFTFDRCAWGSDHKASLIPKEYSAMVAAVREGITGFDVPEGLLGDFGRELEGATNMYRKYFEKGLALACPVRRGDRFKAHHFNALRPLMHVPIPASEFFNLIGCTASRDISSGEILTYDMIERF